MVVGIKVYRRTQKRADYLLLYRPDLMIAVVEPKSEYKNDEMLLNILMFCSMSN